MSLGSNLGNPISCHGDLVDPIGAPTSCGHGATNLVSQLTRESRSRSHQGYY